MPWSCFSLYCRRRGRKVEDEVQSSSVPCDPSLDDICENWSILSFDPFWVFRFSIRYLLQGWGYYLLWALHLGAIAKYVYDAYMGFFICPFDPFMKSGDDETLHLQGNADGKDELCISTLDRWWYSGFWTAVGSGFCLRSLRRSLEDVMFTISPMLCTLTGTTEAGQADESRQTGSRLFGQTVRHVLDNMHAMVERGFRMFFYQDKMNVRVRTSYYRHSKTAQAQRGRGIWTV